ncbi:translocation/assembly module TamB domain-containing protein [Acidisoma sp. 7E03]
MRILRTSAKWLGIALGVILLLMILLVGGVAVAINTAAGQRQIVTLVNRYLGDTLHVAGLSGTVPTDLRLAEVDLRDRDGSWATLSGLALRLRLLPLLHGKLVIDEVHADKIALLRQPLPAPQAKPAPSSAPIRAEIPGLPVQVFLHALTLPQAVATAAFTGTAPVALALQGSAEVTGENQGHLSLSIRSLLSPGSYTARAALSGQNLHATVTLDEPAKGMIATVAGLPALGALHLNLTLDGPQTASQLKLDLAAGALSAHAAGTIDIPGEAAQLSLDAHAPAMSPAPGIAWKKIDVALAVDGPFARPAANGHVDIEGLAAQGSTLDRLTAKIRGDRQQVALDAELAGINAPGLPGGLLGMTPVTVTATAGIAAPDLPVHLTVSHPLAHLVLDGTLKPDQAAHFTLDLPNLAPLAAIGHQDIAGQATINGQAHRTAEGQQMAAQLAADIHLTKALPQAMALTGGEVKLTADAAMAGKTATIKALTVKGAHLDLAAHGSLETTTETLALDWQLALSRIADLVPQATGSVTMTGHAAGTMKDLALQTEVTGTLGTTEGGKAVAELSGPVDLKVDATGLPNTPKAQITLTGRPAGAPADIAIQATRGADGAITATIQKLSWKSLSGQGAIALAPGAPLPTGTVSITLKRLADFRFLIGQPLAGSLSLALQAPAGQAAHLDLDGRNLAFGSNRVSAVLVKADVADPMSAPKIDATARLSGIDAASVRGNASVTAKGPLQALAITLDAKLPDLQGAPANATARATLDLKESRVALSALTAAWHGETLRLQAPSRIAFGKEMGVDRLRLALGSASIDAAGTVSPRLNLNVKIANVTPELLTPIDPTLHAAGRVDAEAHLTGTTAAPSGRITLRGTGLRQTTGAAASLPPATLNARADLAGRTARLDVSLDAGSKSHVTVTGTAPISETGALALAIQGRLDLALLNPIMEAQGRHLAGTVAIALRATGTAKTPAISGSIGLDGGSFQDYEQGLTLTGMTARLRAVGQNIVIDSFTAKAGSGNLTVHGQVGALAPTIPLDLTVTAQNADPVQSDLMTAHFDTNIHVSGAVSSGVLAAGTLNIRRAAINIPDSLPPSVATLNVRRPGDKPPATPSPPLPIKLDLTLTAPRAIFVRGHGLDAELGGRLHLGGTLANLQPSGHFDMIRGTFNLVTTTLTFSSGKVGFDGGKITDPSIDFEATTSSGNVVATLAVTGYASAPKISLTSTPTLPQDEVLAQLLFHSSTSQLSPFQLASIAAAVAQIAGVNTGGGAAGVLNRVRQGLGLDELSIGGASNPSGATTTTSTEKQNAPTLQAGRYVAPGVYVGAAQGTSGGANSTAAQVQIDIAKGLKLQTQVGGDSNGLGVTYQFKY